MSLLWTIPPVAVAVGAAILLTQLRAMSVAADALRVELLRVGEVRAAVLDVRAAAAEHRSALDGLRRR